MMINTTNDTGSFWTPPFVGQSISSASRAIFATIGSIMILCGVLGNGLLITVIFGRIRRKQHLYDLFIASLASADSITLGYWLTFFVLDMILGYHPVVNQKHCVMNGMIICITSAAAILSLLAISVNRYLHVCHSRLYKRLFTWSRTVVICISIWTVSILISIPPALGIDEGVYHYSPSAHQCTFKTSFLTYATTVAVVFTITPMIVIGYCNFAIFRFWKKASEALYGRNDQSIRGRVLSRQGERARKGGEKEVSTGPDTIINKGTHQSEDWQRNPIFDKGENSPTELDEPEAPESRDESADSDGGRTDDETENTSQAMHPLSNDRKNSKEWCVKTTLSAANVEWRLQRQLEDIEDHDGVQDDDDFSKSGKVAPENSGQTNEEGTGMVAGTQTSEVPRPSPSHSPMTSHGRPPSQGNGQNHRTPVIQHSNRRRKKPKKPNAKEVAFVRSLFVVFLLACATMTPYGIITAVRSIVTASSEVRVLAILLMMCNSSVNWLVYGVMNPSFREAYRKRSQQLMGKCFLGK